MYNSVRQLGIAKNQYEGLGTSDDEDSYDDGYEEPDHDSDAGYGEISTDDEELKGIVNGHNDIIVDNDEGPNLNMCSAYTVRKTQKKPCLFASQILSFCVCLYDAYIRFSLSALSFHTACFR